MLAVRLRGESVPRPAAGRRCRRLALSGELRQWHKVTLTLDGPQADETAADPESVHGLPDDRDVRRTSRARRRYTVPGYFAGDGNAANSRRPPATSGARTSRRTRPADGTGASSFVSGKGIAVDSRRRPGRSRRSTAGPARFRCSASDKQAPDFRAPAGCGTSASTICSLPAAATISSRLGPTRRRRCSRTRTSTARRR